LQDIEPAMLVMRSSQSSDEPTVFICTISLFCVLETVLIDLVVEVEVFRTGDVGRGFFVVVEVVVVVDVVVVDLRVVVRFWSGDLDVVDVVVLGSCLCFNVFCCNLFHQGKVVWTGDLEVEVEVVVEGVVIWFHQVLLVVEPSLNLLVVEVPCLSLTKVWLTAVPVRLRNPSP